MTTTTTVRRNQYMRPVRRLSAKDLAGRRTLRRVRAIIKAAGLEALPNHEPHWCKGGPAVGGEVTAAGRGWYLSVPVLVPGTFRSTLYTRTNTPRDPYGTYPRDFNRPLPDGVHDESIVLALRQTASDGKDSWMKGDRCGCHLCERKQNKQSKAKGGAK